VAQVELGSPSPQQLAIDVCEGMNDWLTLLDASQAGHSNVRWLDDPIPHSRDQI
jgi:hypothetical protein